MTAATYFDWLVNNTITKWWNDSATPAEVTRAQEMGICGVTTNPVLTARALKDDPAHWQSAKLLMSDIAPEERAQRLVTLVVRETAARLEPVYRASDGVDGYVCAQVNPSRAGESEPMLTMARRFHAIAPNIAVKLPVTAAGLDVLEDCAAEGITVTGTISFTVSQVLAVAERYEKGRARAEKAGIRPGQCFAVVMVGRLDDYLREIAADRQVRLEPGDVEQAGIAVVKRAGKLFKERSYRATLLPAALRGVNQMQELAGGRLVMSIHPKVQKMILDANLAHEERIEVPVAEDVLARLSQIPDFVRAYAPDGIAVADFLSFGLTQRTLSQFIEAGWGPLESYPA
ncbi:MAG: hypothetical protein GXY52_04570 [Chloroflexi bacterium]|nr:hypothetical protein [Chloroflexota bacterium]